MDQNIKKVMTHGQVHNMAEIVITASAYLSAFVYYMREAFK